MTNGIFQYLEFFEGQQINLGLYTTHVATEVLRRASAETEDAAPSLARGEVIE